MEQVERVGLSDVECCALAHAFAKNPEATSQLKEMMDPVLLKKAADILVRSVNLVRPRHADIDMAYENIAAAEIERLNEEQADFHCKHSAWEHKISLQAVIEGFRL